MEGIRNSERTQRYTQFEVHGREGCLRRHPRPKSTAATLRFRAPVPPRLRQQSWSRHHPAALVGHPASRVCGCGLAAGPLQSGEWRCRPPSLSAHHAIAGRRCTRRRCSNIWIGLGRTSASWLLVACGRMVADRLGYYFSPVI